MYWRRDLETKKCPGASLSRSRSLGCRHYHVFLKVRDNRDKVGGRMGTLGSQLDRLFAKLDAGHRDPEPVGRRPLRGKQCHHQRDSLSRNSRLKLASLTPWRELHVPHCTIKRKARQTNKLNCFVLGTLEQTRSSHTPHYQVSAIIDAGMKPSSPLSSRRTVHQSPSFCLRTSTSSPAAPAIAEAKEGS